MKHLFRLRQSPRKYLESDEGEEEVSRGIRQSDLHCNQFLQRMEGDEGGTLRSLLVGSVRIPLRDEMQTWHNTELQVDRICVSKKLATCS